MSTHLGSLFNLGLTYADNPACIRFTRYMASCAFLAPCGVMRRPVGVRGAEVLIIEVLRTPPKYTGRHWAPPALTGGTGGLLFVLPDALDHFQPQLSETKFTILTDHKACSAFLKTTDITNRNARWLTFYNTFDCYIKYLEGRNNVLADVLSRYFKNPDILPPIIGKPGNNTPIHQ